MKTLLQLTLLLVGKTAIRKMWWAFVSVAFACLVLGVLFVLNLHGLSITATTSLIALLLGALGLRRLVRPLRADGRGGGWLHPATALGFLALSVIALQSPQEDELVAAFVVGSALVLDGMHRLVSITLIRPLAWRWPLALSIAEVVLAGMILLPSPLPSGHAAAFVIGILLLAGAVMLGRFGLALRHVVNVPLPQVEPHDVPLTLHVWLPAGAGSAAPRRFMLDRYIAAVGADGLLKTGHVALSLPPDIYVSLCPVDVFDQSRRDFRRMLVGRSHNDVPGLFQFSLAEESRQRGSPDRELRFIRYDAAALRNFLTVYRPIGHYNLTSRNCASTVALCLDAAFEGALAGKGASRTALQLLVDPRMWRAAFWRSRAEAMTWTPGLMLDYAHALQGVLEPGRPGDATGYGTSA